MPHFAVFQSVPWVCCWLKSPKNAVVSSVSREPRMTVCWCLDIAKVLYLYLYLYLYPH